MPSWLALVVLLLRRGAPIISLLLAAWVVGRAAERAASRFGLPRPEIAALTPALVVTALASARLTAVAPHWRVVVAHPLDLLRVTDGLSLLGGVVGVVGGLVVFSRRTQLPLVGVADLYGVAMPLGVAVYSAGCLLRDDCYGRVAAPPLGIRFPGLEAPRYPVDLYAAAAALMVSGALAWVARRRPAPGILALAAVASLGAVQVLLAPLRLDAESELLSAEQLTTLAVTGGVLVLLQLAALRWWLRRGGTAVVWSPSATVGALRHRERTSR